jgi:hypothetical protein
MRPNRTRKTNNRGWGAEEWGGGWSEPIKWEDAAVEEDVTFYGTVSFNLDDLTSPLMRI